jgi:hypothetical protein
MSALPPHCERFGGVRDAVAVPQSRSLACFGSLRVESHVKALWIFRYSTEKTFLDVSSSYGGGTTKGNEERPGILRRVGIVYPILVSDASPLPSRFPAFRCIGSASMWPKSGSQTAARQRTSHLDVLTGRVAKYERE